MVKTQFVLGLGCFSFLATNGYAQKVKQPNIILIMTDQQRFDAMGCAGNTSIITPNLDRLAAEGNLFSSAYSSVPSSTPARAGLVTGMSPWNHGMLGYGMEAERYEYETPRMLKDLGYYTDGIGKMHWYPQYNTRGFDTVLFDESGRRDTPDFISDYHKWFNTMAPGLNPDSTGIGWNEHRGGVYKLPEKLHPSVWTAQMAIRTIKNYQNNKPLFLKVSFERPHSPYDPPQRVYDKYKSLPAPAAPAMGDWVPKSWLKKVNPKDKPSAAIGNFGNEYAINSRTYYNASITFVDEQIGKIITELKRKGMYDNSLIFFIADHGDMLGDHCLWRKTYAYEGSSHIPFIVKLPKGTPSIVKPGEQISSPVELRDVLPTFLAINKAKQPSKMDGASLLPLFQEKNPKWRKYIDMEHTTTYFKTNYWCALTDGHMKYIYFLTNGNEQLFDLDKDPLENHNISANTNYKAILEKMRQAMVNHLSIRGEDWVKNGKLQIRTSDMLYGKNFPYKGDPYKRPRK